VSVFQARAGESKPCVVIQEVLALWWTRTRARVSEKVKVGAIVKDVKDGKNVVFDVIANNHSIAQIQGTLQGGKVEAEWTIDLPQQAWPNDIQLGLDCTVDDKIRSRSSQRPLLHVDLGLPQFSV
jgi:hypothetical protein